MIFPNYPVAGEVIKTAQYRTLVKAYGVRDPVPCNNDYTFGVLTFPTFNKPYGEGLETDDRWNTEHVLDAQIVMAFWTFVIDNSKKRQFLQL